MNSPDSVTQSIPILVVDDFPAMRRIIRQHLTLLGFTNICEANDGEDALKQLKGAPFELVISDWTMPNIMGIELLRIMRSDPELANIKFVLVTAESQKKNMLEASQAGANGFICKPFTAEILKDKIKAAMENE